MRPLILITNDDGVKAPGIMRLAECVADLADVVIVGPEQPQSGMSSAISVDKPLRINELPDYAGARVFSVNGTPVDCVKLALHTIVPRRPDMLLSGINHGSNSGTSITYSGTMGAVLEGCMVGVPSIGFSLLHHSLKADFAPGMPFVRRIVVAAMDNPLPHWTCLNVNIPAHVVPAGIRVCRAARGHWTEEYKRYTDPQGNPFYLLTGHFENCEPEATDTDEYWLGRNYVSVVPVIPDQSAITEIPVLAGIYDL